MFSLVSQSILTIIWKEYKKTDCIDVLFVFSVIQNDRGAVLNDREVALCSKMNVPEFVVNFFLLIKYILLQESHLAKKKNGKKLTIAKPIQLSRQQDYIYIF